MQTELQLPRECVHVHVVHLHIHACVPFLWRFNLFILDVICKITIQCHCACPCAITGSMM